MKKVVIIGPAYPLKGGLAAFNQRLAGELEEMGIQTIIYTFSFQYPSILYPGRSQFTPEAKRNVLDIRSRINTINPFNWIRVAREIAGLNPDVVICRYWMPYFAPALGSMLRIIKRNCTAQIVGLVDNLIPHEKRPGDSLLTKYFIDPLDSFIALSDSVQRDIESLQLKKPILKLNHPVYDHYGTPVSKSKALEYLNLTSGVTYLLFFGFVRRYKGLDILLHAMAEPTLRNAKIKLLVAGEFYESKKKYTNLIQRLQLEDKVTIYPYYIPDEEVRYFFSASDLIVLPYRTATQSGIAQIALNFERPVLISEVGGLPETVEDGYNGIIAAPTSSGLACSILRFLNLENGLPMHDYKLSKQRQFSWKSFSQDLTEALGMRKLDLISVD